MIRSVIPWESSVFWRIVSKKGLQAGREGRLDKDGGFAREEQERAAVFGAVF